MTTEGKITQLMQMIPVDRRGDFETELSQMVRNFLARTTDGTLTAAQEVEDRERHADPSPDYASTVQINAVWGKPLPH